MELYKLINKVDYCPTCGKNVPYTVKEEKKIRYYMGYKIPYNPLIARCYYCNSELHIPIYMYDNLNKYQEEFKKNVTDKRVNNHTPKGM